MAPIHDRMPVILPKSAWATWLDPDNDDIETLSGLLAAGAGHAAGRHAGEHGGQQRAQQGPRAGGADRRLLSIGVSRRRTPVIQHSDGSQHPDGGSHDLVAVHRPQLRSERLGRPVELGGVHRGRRVGERQLRHRVGGDDVDVQVGDLVAGDDQPDAGAAERPLLGDADDTRTPRTGGRAARRRRRSSDRPRRPARRGRDRGPSG